MKTEKEDSFWGDSKPYESPKRKVSNGTSRREREDGDDWDRRDQRDKRRHELDYDDERKPIDLGREARPYPPAYEGSSR